MAEIIVRNLHKAFGDFNAVINSNFTIANGEFFVMLGPSGCGKTTTLRMIAGLEMADRGSIHLDGQDITYLRGSQRDIAFVFQFFALYPHMNVRQNISFPLRVQGLARKEIKKRIEEVASMLRIEHLLTKRVGGLSGGDKQRVALGRAIIRRAKAFLMDEPLGALDAEFRELMCKELKTLHSSINATTVYVTHDQVEAMSMGDRICVMDHGSVMQIGTPQEIYARPRTRFVASFIGSPAMNFLPVHGAFKVGDRSIHIGGKQIGIPQLRTKPERAEVLLGIRPEDITVTSLDRAEMPGEVIGIEYMGSRRLITVETKMGQIRTWLSNDRAIQYKQNIGLVLSSTRSILFDKTNGAAVDSVLFDEGGGTHG